MCSERKKGKQMVFHIHTYTHFPSKTVEGSAGAVIAQLMACALLLWLETGDWHPAYVFFGPFLCPLPVLPASPRSPSSPSTFCGSFSILFEYREMTSGLIDMFLSLCPVGNACRVPPVTSSCACLRLRLRMRATSAVSFVRG